MTIQGNDKKLKIVIASDIHSRDGIGVEAYQGSELLIEIFRDDKRKTRTVSIFKTNTSLSQMEETIEAFKKEIPWEFCD